MSVVAYSKSMSFAEAAAKHVIETVLIGAQLEFREEQSHREYDFHLRYPNDAFAAVEVTRSVDPTQMRTSAAIHSNKKEPVVAAVRCKNTWTIIPEPNANITAIRDNIDRYLSVLEDLGLKNFSAFEAHNSRQLREAGLLELFASDAVPRCVEDVCCDLRIQGGSIISSEGVPKIIIGHPLYGGAVDASCAIEAGRAECWKSDNRKKLGAAETNERHLVVFVDATRGSAWIALTHFEPPDAMADLPPEIKNLWLIGDLGDGSKYVVWRASTGQAWQKLVVECA